MGISERDIILYDEFSADSTLDFRTQSIIKNASNLINRSHENENKGDL
jgi:hypothetical protein